MILEALDGKIQELEKKGLLPRGEMRPMRKADIAKRIHQKAGISEQEAATLVEWILEFLKTTLQKMIRSLSTALASLRFTVRLLARAEIPSPARP